MITSRTTSLCEPVGTEPIPASTLRYMRARNLRRIYSLIIEEFKNSGLSQADLARRLNNSPEVICRWFAGPTNLRANTISDLLFAISGAEAAYELHYPVQDAKRNSGFPEWLNDSSDNITGVIGETIKVETYIANTRSPVELDLISP